MEFKTLNVYAICITLFFSLILSGCVKDNPETPEEITETFLYSFQKKDYDKTNSFLAGESEYFNYIILNTSEQAEYIKSILSKNVEYKIINSEITDSLNARVNVEISNINMQNEMSKILSDLFEYGNEQFAAGKSSNDIDFNSKIIELLEDRLENNTPETISKTIEISFIKGNNGNWEIVTDTNIFDAITGGYVSFSQRLQSSLNIYTDENDINNLDE